MFSMAASSGELGTPILTSEQNPTHSVNRPELKWTHEQGSIMMLQSLVDENGIEISQEDLKFVMSLIAGEYVDGEKQFLYQIVANKLNSLDVDK